VINSSVSSMPGKPVTGPCERISCKHEPKTSQD
jgi:hypothetical protein